MAIGLRTGRRAVLALAEAALPAALGAKAWFDDFSVYNGALWTQQTDVEHWCVGARRAARGGA
jgi:hypothetical protein